MTVLSHLRQNYDNKIAVPLAVVVIAMDIPTTNYPAKTATVRILEDFRNFQNLDTSVERLLQLHRKFQVAETSDI